MNEAELSEALKKEIKSIKATLEEAKVAGQSFNEAQTEYIVIEPLLKCLGYAPLEISKQGHDSVANNFPDYTIFPGKPQKWFLEAKKLDLSLQDGQAAQAVNYANNQGAEWAVLTNGRKWYIYNAHLPKPLHEKKIFEIGDIFNQANAVELLSLLSRDAVQNNRLSEAWTKQRLSALISEQLTTQNSETRKLIRRIYSQQTNTLVSDKVIGTILEAFAYAPVMPSAPSSLQNILPQSQADTATVCGKSLVNTAAKITPPALKQILPQQSESNHYTLAELAEDLTLASGRRPSTVCFEDGKPLKIRYWRDFAIHLAEWLNKIHGFHQIPFKVTETGENFFINVTPSHPGDRKMTNPAALQISGETVYMETCQNTAEKLRTLVVLMHTVGADPSHVTIDLAKSG